MRQVGSEFTDKCERCCCNNRSNSNSRCCWYCFSSVRLFEVNNINTGACYVLFVLCAILLVPILPLLILTGTFDDNNLIPLVVFYSIVGVALFCSLFFIIMECIVLNRGVLYSSIDNIDI